LSWDFFFAVFGLGVGVWRRFDFGDSPGSGVSRGVDDGVVSSVSPDSLADFVSRVRGDFFGPGDSLLSLADFPFADFSGVGVGDFLGLRESSVPFRDSSSANLPLGMAVDASSGVGEVRCFFGDLLVALFAAGLGDFFGFGDDAALVSLGSGSSRRLFCSSLTCARRRPVMIAPTESAVARQMRKRTTATERNRARDAINGYSSDLLKKLQRSMTSFFLTL
jgi:hypothetical protein